MRGRLSAGCRSAGRRKDVPRVNHRFHAALL